MAQVPPPNYPLARRRKDVSQKLIFLAGEYAWKGPYEAFHLYNLLNRSAIFSALQTPCVVLAHDTIETNDGTFVRFPNVMASYTLSTEIYTEPFSGATYEVVIVPPVPTLDESIGSNWWVWDHLVDLLVALCHFYIIGVGNVNLSNILADRNTTKIYLVDYDAHILTERDDPLFYFTSLPSKIPWYEKSRKYYRAVAERLRPLLDHGVIIASAWGPRVQRTIDLLVKYSEQPLMRLNVIRQNRGKMMWIGSRGGSKTYSGLDFDVVKSALQKYIRRNVPEKAVLAAIELYRLNEVDASSVVTNLYGRLAIIAAEDVGPGNLPLVLAVLKYVRTNDHDIDRLVNIVRLLAASPKTRIMSHAWFAYASDAGRAKAIAAGLTIDTQISENDWDYVQSNMNLPIFDDNDPPKIRPYILVFLQRLRDFNYNAFAWASFYLSATTDISLTRRGKYIGRGKGHTGRPDILLWSALGQVMPAEIHDILCHEYFSRRENLPFLQLAIFVALHQLPYEKFDLLNAPKDPETSNLLNGKRQLIVDDYVFDKHTMAGRHRGRGLKHFVLEGAIVSPQHHTYYHHTLEGIYQSQE